MLLLYTFCVNIGKHSEYDLELILQLLIKSIHKNITKYKLICYTNFKINDKSIIKNFNIEFRDYYDNTKKKLYNDKHLGKWLNLSFNKINIYKDLYDEFKLDFTWIDLDTIVTYDISYIIELSNVFIKNGGDCIIKNKLFSNNDTITVERNKYIQGNVWKLNIKLYEKLMQTNNKLQRKKLKLRYDLQDLFNYYIYIENNDKLKDINIIGKNIYPNVLCGLCVWDKKGNTHATLNGLEKLYYEDGILKSKIYKNDDIHILSFTFITLKELYQNHMFKKLFNYDVQNNICILSKNIQEFKFNDITLIQNDNYKSTFADTLFKFDIVNENKNMSSSDILKFLCSRKKNSSLIEYNTIILEICSVESTYDDNLNKIDGKIELFHETINNIIKIKELTDSKIIVLPPIFNNKQEINIETYEQIKERLHISSYESDIFMMDLTGVNIVEKIYNTISQNNNTSAIWNKNKQILNNTINIFTLDSKNFGDGVNKLFWEKITKKKIINDVKNDHYFTTGSIMCMIHNNTTIFGTGFISKDGDLGGNNFRSSNNKIINKPKNIIAVRGPHSRQKLLDNNIECPQNYGDPLILMPCIYNKFIDNTKNTTNIIGIIPHYIDNNATNLKTLINNLKKNNYIIKIINIEIGNNYKKIIDEINECNYIISSSLHGVIMGLVYKKKTIFIEFDTNVIGSTFKFNDFFCSLGIKYTCIKTYNEQILENIIHIDYNNLINLGHKFIYLIPFIDINRKRELSNTYTTFYSSI